ncbi:uncharacterized protein RJT21DRAFT_118853 [Scheffersomyces amazonensis]|uniref:uncharacterized protein n=1 Tax=Scheffersomyces amazonensis TaxID=1078765 RepID=UPI00315CFC44
MQGSYKNNGLPRPYYMKPSKKRMGVVGTNSPYDNFKQPVVFFTNSPRKLLGYLVMLLLFGTCIYWMSQDLKPQPDPTYEIVKTTGDLSNENIKNNEPPIIGDIPEINVKSNGNNENKNINVDIDDINDNVNIKNNEKISNVDVNKAGNAKKDSDNIDLAGNFAKGSKGEKGIGVVEAPKGGVANEAPIVGSDEDKIIGTGKNSRNKQAPVNVNVEGGKTNNAKGKQDNVVYNGAGGPPDGKPVAKVAPGTGRGYKADKNADDESQPVGAAAPAAEAGDVAARAKNIIDDSF